MRWKVWDDLDPVRDKQSWCPGLWHPWDGDFGKQALYMFSSWRSSSAWLHWVRGIQNNLTRQTSPCLFSFLPSLLFHSADFSQHCSTLLLEGMPGSDFCWHRWQTSQFSWGGSMRNQLIFPCLSSSWCLNLGGSIRDVERAQPLYLTWFKVK